MKLTFKLTEGQLILALGAETEVKNLIINDLVLVENGEVSEQAQDLVNSLSLEAQGELRQLN
jgi:hypothetical protein